jgi:hypothetical protein
LTATNINATDKVGVWTTTTFSLLHLHKNALAQDVRLSFTDNTSGVSIIDGFRVGKDAQQIGYIYNCENNAISIGTNNTERMRIAGNGKVGIGITNPIHEITIVKDNQTLCIGKFYNDCIFLFQW